MHAQALHMGSHLMRGLLMAASAPTQVVSQLPQVALQRLRGNPTPLRSPGTSLCAADIPRIRALTSPAALGLCRRRIRRGTGRWSIRCSACHAAPSSKAFCESEECDRSHSWNLTVACRPNCVQPIGHPISHSCALGLGRPNTTRKARAHACFCMDGAQ